MARTLCNKINDKPDSSGLDEPACRQMLARVGVGINILILSDSIETAVKLQ